MNPLLQGTLPEFPVHGLLEELELSDTSFSGELPDSIGNLTFLSRLNFEYVGFNGSIPQSVSNLNQLQVLTLPINRFTGTIPTTIFTLPLLRELDLSMNQFTGNLGEFSNGSSSPMKTLDLSDNKLQGPIPKSVFELSGLESLVLSSNNFSGRDGPKKFSQPGLIALAHYNISIFRLFLGCWAVTTTWAKIRVSPAVGPSVFSGTISLSMIFHKLRNITEVELSSNGLSVDIANVTFALFPQVTSLKLGSCSLKEFPIF